MKSFFVDLYEMVWKPELGFIKQHWRSYCVIIVVSGLVSLVSYNRDWFEEKAALICGKLKRK